MGLPRRFAGLEASGWPGRRWCASWRAGAGLVLLCLSVSLPGFFTIPPVDRDESRFAQASRQMLESVALPRGEQRADFHDGGLVIPKVQARPRLNKPPMIYWLQAGSAAVFTGGDPLRDAIWMYRVPSLLAAIVTVLATWRMGLSMFDARAAVLGAALLGVCPLFAWEAHQARADHVMVAATTVAMGALWRVWRGRATDFVGSGTKSVLREGRGPLRRVHHARSHRRCARAGNVGGTMSALVLWVAIGVGILTKGPITPMIVALAAISLCIVTRRWSWLGRTRSDLGLLILAAMIGPWVWAVGERVGWDAYLGIVRDEVLGRSVEAKEGHWGPPGYHTVLLAVLFWPGSLTTARAVGRAWRRGLSSSDRRESPSASPPATSTRPAGRSAELEWRPSRWRSIALRMFAGWRDRVHGRDAELFCLAWILPAWLVFEIVSTKLPHYTMPMYPAVALLSARAVLARASSGLSIGMAFWRLLSWVLLVAAGLVAAFFLFGLTVAFRFFDLIGLAILIPLLVFAARRFTRTSPGEGSWSGPLLAAMPVAVAVGIAAYNFAAPAIALLSSVMARSLHRVDPEGRRPVAAVEYHEPSLVFLTRARIELISAAELPAWYENHPDGLWIAPFSVTSLPYRGMDTWHDHVWWMNFASGRVLGLCLYDAERYQAAPAPEPGE